MTKIPDIELAWVCGDGRAPRGARLRAQHVWPPGIGEGDPEHDDWRSEDTPARGLRRWFDHHPESLGAFPRRHRVMASSVTDMFFALLPAGDHLRRMTDEATVLPARCLSDAAKNREASHAGE